MTDRASWLRFEVRLFRDDTLEWFLLTGDRRLVSALQLGVLVTTVTAVVNSRLVPLQSDTPVLFLLFALIAGNFTLIAIVTSLSQFVLGRRLESPGEIRAEIDETIAYRRDVSETSGTRLMPVKPDAFLLQLYRNARDDLESLTDVTAETRTKRTREELEDLVAGLETHIDYVVTLLKLPSSGLKHALFVTLATDYENYVHRTWYLQTEYDDEYTDEVGEPLTRLTETLEHMVVATRMFKTTFIESEVSELSRYLLYVGLPAQIAAVLVTLFYTTAGTPPSVSSGTLKLLVPAVLTAGFAPFLVLSSYVVRLSIVARRTAESFPFSSQLDSALTARGEFGDDA